MKRYLITGLLFLVAPLAINAQAIPEAVKQLQQQLLQLNGMTYEYTIDYQLPDQTTGSFKGKVQRAGNSYIESNPRQLIIQDRDWYYKLDHSSKTIFIVSVRKLEQTVWKNRKNDQGGMSLVPDSLLSRYGKISVATEGKITKLTVTFGRELLVRELYLEYDNQKKLPVLYRVKMDRFYRIDPQTFDESYMRQTMTAARFSLAGTMEKPSDYFSFESGKIRLKKYTNYRLITQL